MAFRACSAMPNLFKNDAPRSVILPEVNLEAQTDHCIEEAGVLTISSSRVKIGCDIGSRVVLSSSEPGRSWSARSAVAILSRSRI